MMVREEIAAPLLHCIIQRTWRYKITVYLIFVAGSRKYLGFISAQEGKSAWLKWQAQLPSAN